ncbi:hypothetical protein AIOL_004265 [Candidatus Rhodobacter oscarellae]|uniref:Lipoprotein n=1 Tax=Candidatus Rhodobacter oscarellae TaxID=1675527 RepID=A0A0J9EC64_9RHOB|nr:hypothetical protein [Candidatus Rhodobacter lobularis]KMW59284.1 hypothetical protein AIOL_004265 [Candidatus Rhodobacter lobularis]
MIRAVLILPLLVALAACGAGDVPTRAQIDAPDLAAAAPDPDPAPIAALTDQNTAQLARLLLGLSPQVDPEEAARAASIAYSYTAQLKSEYGITDPPLIHNAKVNAGLRPRGLCWHWAEDMERRLKAEAFQTLELHRAIANHDNILIDHSTAIISAKGATMFDGVILDPWRKGGRLVWMPVLEDRRYGWRPRAEVLQYYRDRDTKRG